MNLIKNPTYLDSFAIIKADLIKYTPQLVFSKTRNREIPPKADSSSILITVQNRFFLITTGHTLHNRSLQTIGIMLENIFYSLSGKSAYHEPNIDFEYEPNKLDMGVVELDEYAVSILKRKYEFLQIEQMDFYHFNSKQFQYLIYGYPVEKTSKDINTKIISPYPISLFTIEETIENYLLNNIDIKRVIMLKGEQNRLLHLETKLEKTKPLPLFEGLSGCGVWRVEGLMSIKPEYKLVSMITGSTETQDILYSTKVTAILGILKMNFGLDI
ncbi:hypothetical protein BH11BAC5_BH11BAC5_14220 [soil metagenome]